MYLSIKHQFHASVSVYSHEKGQQVQKPQKHMTLLNIDDTVDSFTLIHVVNKKNSHST